MATDVLEHRYGGTRTRRWPVLLASAILGTLGVGWIVWVAADHAGGALSYELSGYDVVSENKTVVSIELARENGAPAECEIYAQAEDHSIVGERVVSVPAGEPGTIRVDEAIRTDRRAVNGVLRTCRQAG